MALIAAWQTGQNATPKVRILQSGKGRKYPQFTYLAAPYAPTAPAGGGVLGGVQVAQLGSQELGNGVEPATSELHLIVVRPMFAATLASGGSPEGDCEPPYSSAS